MKSLLTIIALDHLGLMFRVAHERTNIIAAGERETVRANGCVSSEISAMCSRKMAKCMPLWTISNAFTRERCTPNELTRARRTGVKQAFWLTEEDVHAQKVRKETKERIMRLRRTNLFLIFRPPSLPLIKKLRFPFLPEALLHLNFGNVLQTVVLQRERWHCTKCSSLSYSSNCWKEVKQNKMLLP